MVQIKDFTFNAFQTRCSLVWDEGGKCAIIDPGCSVEAEFDQLVKYVGNKGLKVQCIMLTHAHFDHILGVAKLKDLYGIPVYMHPAEKATIANNEIMCKGVGLPVPEAFGSVDAIEGDVIEVGILRFEVIETPGHTPGGVSYLERKEKLLFSGDTLFAGTIGRTDLLGGDYDLLMKSVLEKLVTLDGDITIVPGHGPCSEIAKEGMTNPFLLPFNEPVEEW